MLWRRILLAVSIGLNAILLYSLIWGDKGAFAYKQLKEQCASLQVKIREYDAMNLALSKEIRLLQSDEKYQEKMIRNRLNFVRDNEILYLFPEESTADSSGAQPHETKN